jgi:ribonucleotide monophosphatase NagD (HAD superfamily)
MTGVPKRMCAVVGDRSETDILMAKNGGCLGILVLTGISTSQRVEDYPHDRRPDLIFKSILDLAQDYQPQ